MGLHILVVSSLVRKTFVEWLRWDEHTEPTGFINILIAGTRVALDPHHHGCLQKNPPRRKRLWISSRHFRDRETLVDAVAGSPHRLPRTLSLPPGVSVAMRETLPVFP